MLTVNYLEDTLVVTDVPLHVDHELAVVLPTHPRFRELTDSQLQDRLEHIPGLFRSDG